MLVNNRLALPRALLHRIDFIFLANAHHFLRRIVYSFRQFMSTTKHICVIALTCLIPLKNGKKGKKNGYTATAYRTASENMRNKCYNYKK